jgi:hypothetical protein
MADKKPPSRQRPYAAYQPKPTRPDYEHFAPGAGYTPPYRQPEPPPPPKNVFQRARQLWRGYRGMGQRARADSMVWWLYKGLQGIMFGGSLFTVGVLVTLFSTVMGHLVCLDGGGIAAMIGGLVLLLYFAAAPSTQRWIVYVPENQYWVVEDHTGQTLEFLGPGRMHVAWQRGCKVRDYASFRWLNIKTRVENLLQFGASKVSLDIDLVMDFNPVRAEPDEFARLRSLDSAPKFEALITQEVQRILRYHLNRMPGAQQQHMVHHPHLIEDLIAGELERFETMGLALASSRPVNVAVHGAPPRSDSAPLAAPLVGKPSDEPTQPKALTPLPKPRDAQPTIQHTAGPPIPDHAPDITQPAALPPADRTAPYAAEPDSRAAEDTVSSDPPSPSLKTPDDLIDPLSLRRRSRKTPPPPKG